MPVAGSMESPAGASMSNHDPATGSVLDAWPETGAPTPTALAVRDSEAMAGSMRIDVCALAESRPLVARTSKLTAVTAPTSPAVPLMTPVAGSMVAPAGPLMS